MAATSEARPRAIASGLFDHYDSIADIEAYYGVLAIYALARSATQDHDEPTLERVDAVVRRFPEQIDHPRYNFPSYRIGGIAQAFLSSQGRLGERVDLLREYADEMMTATRDEKGILSMPGAPGLIWIDAAMAAVPFLLYAGKALGESRYIDEAVNQAVLMYDEFVDPSNGLLRQCKGFVAPGVLSQDHWGRGNGWGFFALAELLRGLPAGAGGRAEIEERFVALATSLLPHQSARGLWRQEIPMATAWEESSGSGLITYSLGVGIECGTLMGERWRTAVRRGLRGLAGWCINPDFSTENSCPGTLCPGEGDAKGTVQAYVELAAPHRNELHGFAPLILAMTVADVVGIDRLTLRAGPQSDVYLPTQAS